MTLAGSHPCHARPDLGITHLQRCWRRDGWARVGTSPAHFPHCGAPDGAHAGEREGGREKRRHLGKQSQPQPGCCPSLAAGEWGWAEGALIQDLAGRVSSLAQRCLSGSDPSALTQAQWGAFRQQGGNVTASQSLAGPPRLTSPRCPTAMRAQVGWKAPVPHASRWVRLWGCSTRTKLAHST